MIRTLKLGRLRLPAPPSYPENEAKEQNFQGGDCDPSWDFLLCPLAAALG